MYLLLKKDGNFPAQSSGVFGRLLVVFQYVPVCSFFWDDRSICECHTPLGFWGMEKKHQALKILLGCPRKLGSMLVSGL